MCSHSIVATFFSLIFLRRLLGGLPRTAIRYIRCGLDFENETKIFSRFHDNLKERRGGLTATDIPLEVAKNNKIKAVLKSFQQIKDITH